MKKQFPVSPKPKHRLLPLAGGGSTPPLTSVSDEADALFPDLKQSPIEPKLRPPIEYLGRNPYSELKRRAEHAQHLAAVDGETQSKIREAQALLAARRAAQDAIVNPQPSALTDAELQAGPLVLTLAEERRAEAQRALPPLRAGPPLQRLTTPSSVISGMQTPLSPTMSVVSPVVRAMSPYWTTTGVATNSGAASWSQEGVAIRPPTVSAVDAKSSKSQMAKHKAGKHTGYFGEELLAASAKRIRKDESGGDEDDEAASNPSTTSPRHQQQQRSPLSFPGRVLTFTEPAERLLAMHPSTSSVDVCANVQWTLDAFCAIDGPGLKMIFGKDAIPMVRVSAQIHRNSEACPKGNPMSDPPAFLPDLRASIYGKPSAYWPGDAVTAELYLSRYAYTSKFIKITTSCKAYPNVFSQFGVDGEALELVSPFPLRLLPGATSVAAQDVSMLSLTYHGKTQTRLLRASFPLPLFQGLVPCDATLSVSGTPRTQASSSSPPPLTTIDLLLSIPDHVDNFYFKSAAANLAFFDALDGTQRTFRIVQQQHIAATLRQDLLKTPTVTSTSSPITLGDHSSSSIPTFLAAATSGVDNAVRTTTIESRNEISFLWSLLRVPLMLKLFDQDPNLVMRGRLTHETSHRGVSCRSPSPSDRSCTLWNFIKLQQLVAFVECVEGVTHYGVECVAELDVSSGGAAAEKTRLRFKGRLCAIMSEHQKALLPSGDAGATLRSTAATPSTNFRFEGLLEENAWNYVGGCPCAFLKHPTLEFTVDASTLLPRDIRVSGANVLQTSDPGVGVSSEHGYTAATYSSSQKHDDAAFDGRSGKDGGGVAIFPIDSLPHYVYIAPLVPQFGNHGSSSDTPTVSLSEIVRSLLHPGALVASTTTTTTTNADGVAQSSMTDAVVGLLHAADRAHLHKAHLVVNDSPDELVVSAAQAREGASTTSLLHAAFSSGTPRFECGTTIQVQSATVWVHGAPQSASGVITLSRRGGDEDAAILLDAVMQLSSTLLDPHAAAAGAIGSATTAGVGPQWRLQLVIPSCPPPSPTPAAACQQNADDAHPILSMQAHQSAANTTRSVWEEGKLVQECGLQNATMSLAYGGGNQLPITEYRVVTHGPSANSSEVLAGCSVVALCVPPRITLEHRPDVLAQTLHSFMSPTSSRSIQTALTATYKIQLRIGTSAGTTLCRARAGVRMANPSQPLWDIVDSNVNVKLKCGIFEALRDTFFGKVAEFRVLCVQKRQQWLQHVDFLTTTISELDVEVRRRKQTIIAVNADATSLSLALSSAAAEVSNLASYWKQHVAHSGRSSMVTQAKDAAERDAAHVAQNNEKHRDAALAWHLKEIGAAVSHKALPVAKLATVSSALSLMTNSLERGLDAGVWSTLRRYHDALISSLRTGAQPDDGEHNMPPTLNTPYLSEGNATVAQHLRTTHMHHLRMTLQYAKAMIEAFSTIVNQLELDEVIFPSLCTLHDVSLAGGQRQHSHSDDGGRPASSSPLSMFLVMSGVLRGHIFRTQTALGSLDHLAVVSAVDRLSSDMLNMYLSLLRFQ